MKQEKSRIQKREKAVSRATCKKKKEDNSTDLQFQFQQASDKETRERQNTQTGKQLGVNDFLQKQRTSQSVPACSSSKKKLPTSKKKEKNHERGNGRRE